jgi:hypothetical protein
MWEHVNYQPSAVATASSATDHGGFHCRGAVRAQRIPDYAVGGWLAPFVLCHALDVLQWWLLYTLGLSAPRVRTSHLLQGGSGGAAQ